MTFTPSCPEFVIVLFWMMLSVDCLFGWSAVDDALLSWMPWPPTSVIVQFSTRFSDEARSSMPSPGMLVMVQSRTMLRSAVPEPLVSLPSKTMPRPREPVTLTRSTRTSSPPSKSSTSLVERGDPPANTVMSRTVIATLLEKSNGSVSVAALVLFWMSVTSTP